MTRAERLTLGERIRAARDAKDFSQRDLAERAGLTHGWVFQVEAGTIKNPRYKTVAACAKALGVSLQWLMTGEGTQPTEAA